MRQDAAVRSGEGAGHSVIAEKSRFYLYLSLWMWVIALVGFGPGYGSSLVTGTSIRSIPVHMHAVVYVAWLFAYTYQSSLPSADRLGQHRRLGQQLVVYAVLMVIVGLTVTFSRFDDLVEIGQFNAASAELIRPLTDMLIFPTLFAVAVYFRRSPETHKRLMVVATTTLLVAAVARMRFLGSPPHPLIYGFVWLSPIWIAMLRDAFVERKVYPAYAISIVALAVVPYRYLLAETETYRSFTTWLASLT